MSVRENAKCVIKVKKAGSNIFFGKPGCTPNLSAAAAIAKEIGLEGSPAENPKCLKCHGPLYEKALDFKQEGVSCEVCHGPGSAYKKLSIMKNHAESVKNGVTEYGSPEAIKKQCLSCHEKAHGKDFDFAAAWEKVQHPRPEKK